MRVEQLVAMADLYRNNLTSREPAVEPGGPVVSLTSFGQRARTVAFTLESIARGSRRPSRLILWLDEPGLLEQPTSMLRRLMARGVELRATENFGPHKKYFPYVQQSASFDVPLVTADDDVLYPRSWLAGLMDRHAALPEAVHCYRARLVGLRGRDFEPYASWRECETSEPSHRHFSIGMAGVLLPEPVLRELKRKGDAFRATCPKTDDIWLNLQAQRVGAKVQQVHAKPQYFMLLPGTQKVGLLHGNVHGANHSALAAVYTPEDLQRLS